MQREKVNAQKKNIKMQKLLRQIICILIIVMVLDISAGLVAAGYVRKQAVRSVTSATEYYSAQIDTIFEDINDYLGEEMVANKDVALLSYSDDPLSVIQATQNINNKLEFYRSKLGGSFHFFIFYPEKDYFVSSDRGELELQEYQELRQDIANRVMGSYEDEGVKAGKRWRIIRSMGNYYALNYITIEGLYACCFIDTEDLVKMVDIIPMGEESFVSLVSENGDVYFGEEELERMGLLKSGGKKERGLLETKFGFQSGRIYHPLEYAQFGLCVMMKNNQQLLAAVFLQGAIGVLFLCGIAAAGGILYRMKKKVIDPLRYFSENLSKIQEGNPEIYFGDTNLVELEEANQIFKKILGQMKEMRIHMYEQTLEKQKLEMDFMKLQVQPHFYINCMSLIYNMACMGEDDTIQQFSAYVSKYFRYIFRSNSDYVSITEEIGHISNYLEIYKIRYRSRLDYAIEQDGNLDDVVIPPLLLHTFVENAVKYGKNGDKCSFIRFQAQRMKIEGVEFVVISVEDNGPGFPENVLEELVQGKDIVTEKGTRIGIMNCVQRLKIIYENRARVSFHNGRDGGALVKVCIPIWKE